MLWEVQRWRKGILRLRLAMLGGKQRWWMIGRYLSTSRSISCRPTTMRFCPDRIWNLAGLGLAPSGGVESEGEESAHTRKRLVVNSFRKNGSCDPEQGTADRGGKGVCWLWVPYPLCVGNQSSLWVRKNVRPRMSELGSTTDLRVWPRGVCMSWACGIRLR